MKDRLKSAVEKYGGDCGLEMMKMNNPPVWYIIANGGKIKIGGGEDSTEKIHDTEKKKS